MINQVSWADYWTVLAIITLAYYIIVVLLYFRKETLQLLTGRSKVLPVRAEGQANPPQTSTNEQVQFATVKELMDELKPIFEQKYVKEELLMAIQLKLKAFQQLKGSAFEVAINNFIEMEAENKCSVYLSEQELRGLWV